MYQYQYDTARDLQALANKHHMTIAEIAIAHEAQRDEVPMQVVIDKMHESLDVMRANVTAGIYSDKPSIGGLIGQSAKKMSDYVYKRNTIGGAMLGRSIAFALAITEENARMKRIVACPTAGASGVVPGCLLAYGEVFGASDEAVIDALFHASAIGIIIAHGASISGAEGGCQAEVGTASAMAASALTGLSGGSVRASLDAAAMALKNMMGLVCDPVAGLVEVPCSKRNAGGIAGAICAADMALAGIQSFIPLDEVIGAMKQVGKSLPLELKETAKGGVAATKTAKAVKKEIQKRTNQILEK